MGYVWYNISSEEKTMKVDEYLEFRPEKKGQILEIDVDGTKHHFLLLRKGRNSALIDLIGAQLVSYKVDGVEVMFEGAKDAIKGVPTQWGKTAPVLFPNPGPVGKTKGKNAEPVPEVERTRNGKKEKRRQYSYNGGLYSAVQHGFAQFSEFGIQGLTEDSCVLSIDADQKTVEEYPFDFRFYVCYELGDDGSLKYTSAANNLDNQPMLAGQGWHPAFKLHDDPKNYKIVFKNVEKDEGCEIEEDVEYDIDEPYIKQNKSKSFSGIKSADVQIVYHAPNGQIIPYLEMHTAEPRFVLWSRDRDYDPAGHDYFIALEPWNTNSKVIQELTTRSEIESLGDGVGGRIVQPGEVDELNAQLRVNPEYIRVISRPRERSNREEYER